MPQGTHLAASALACLFALAAAGPLLAQGSGSSDWRARMLEFNARQQRGPEPAETDAGPPLSDEEKARHALNRLAFGARPGQVDDVAAMGWEAWARQQLEPRAIDDSAVESTLRERYPSLGMTMTQAFATYRPPYANDPPTPEDQAERNRLQWKIRRELQESVVYRAVYSERQFQEVIVEFWRNHFNIDQNKDDTAYLANHWEEQVLRRFAFGDFEDLLLATARHPAMLIYLDNIVSQRPLTDREQDLLAKYEGRKHVPRSVQALGRERGLNENYARELMELHTLGVDNGYTQRDVTELARVLTGWSAGPSRDGRLAYGDADAEYGFVFRDDVHDDAAKRVLDVNLPARGGEEQGIRVVRGLAHHPKTAEFISWKLCRYLVRDQPSEDLVQRVARVFRQSDGDLPQVYAAIIFSPDFTYRQNYAAKFKTPFEFVASSLRATDADLQKYDGVLHALHRMGQPVYGCVDPTGYYDQAEAWLDPGVLVYRWMYALGIGGGNVEGAFLPDDYLRSLELLPHEELADRMMRQFAANSTNPEHDRLLRQGILEAGSVPAALGLALGSPAFQQQ